MAVQTARFNLAAGMAQGAVAGAVIGAYLWYARFDDDMRDVMPRNEFLAYMALGGVATMAVFFGAWDEVV